MQAHIPPKKISANPQYKILLRKAQTSIGSIGRVRATIIEISIFGTAVHLITNMSEHAQRHRIEISSPSSATSHTAAVRHDKKERRRSKMSVRMKSLNSPAVWGDLDRQWRQYCSRNTSRQVGLSISSPGWSGDAVDRPRAKDCDWMSGAVVFDDR